MAYTTAILVRASLGINQLTMLLGAKLSERLSNDLMNATIDNDDRSPWSVDEQAIADNAITLVNDTIAVVDRTINGYLIRNYDLPLEESVIDDSPLRDIASKLTAYELYSNPDDAQTTRYNHAIKKLESYNSGKMRLSELAPEPATSNAAVVVGGGESSTFDLSRF